MNVAIIVFAVLFFFTFSTVFLLISTAKGSDKLMEMLGAVFLCVMGIAGMIASALWIYSYLI